MSQDKRTIKIQNGNVEFARYQQTDLQRIRPTSNEGYPNGIDNLFSDYLNGLVNAAPTHGGIINDFTFYALGKGLVVDDPMQQAIIDRHFPLWKTREIIYLDAIQATRSLEILKDSLFNIKEINVLLPNQIRVTKIKDGKPFEFLFRRSWNKSNRYSYELKADYQAYEENCELRKSLFYSYESGTYDVPYGRPTYMSGLNAIEMQAGIYLMHNHGLQQGMFPSAIFDFETSGDDKQDAKTAAQIVHSISGAANAGKPIILNRPQGSEPINITVPSMPGMDKVYTAQYETAETGIMQAHGLPSQTLIAGLTIKPTGFGDAEEEMQWALNQWRQKRIYPYRRDLLKDLAPIFRELGITGEVRFEDEQDDNQQMSYSYDSETLDTPTVNSVLTSLTGKQMQQIQRTVRKFKKGELEYAEAAILLKKGFGFTEEECREFLKNTEQFMARMKKNDAIQKNDNLEKFISCGEEEHELGDYDLIMTDRLDGEPSSLDLNDCVKLATVPSSSWQETSEQDTPLFKVRYRYGGNPIGERDFCNRVMRAGKVYRKEDITQLEDQRVNPGFGPNGSDTYNVWFYKGGPQCRHFWERRVYMRRNNRPITVTEARSILNELPIEERDQNRLEVNDPNVARIPQDMPNNGYLNPR